MGRKKYKMLKNSSKENLQELIDERAKEGWECQGGIKSYESTDNGEITKWYVQAMVKE